MNTAHTSITITKPVKMPKLKGSPLINPFLLPLLIQAMVLGPGVETVTVAKIKNADQSKITSMI